MKNLNMQEAIPLTPPVVDIGHPENGLFKTADPDVPILIRNDGFPLGYISSPEDADPVAIYRELNQLSAVPPCLDHTGTQTPSKPGRGTVPSDRQMTGS